MRRLTESRCWPISWGSGDQGRAAGGGLDSASAGDVSGGGRGEGDAGQGECGGGYPHSGGIGNRSWVGGPSGCRGEWVPGERGSAGSFRCGSTAGGSTRTWYILSAAGYAIDGPCADRAAFATNFGAPGGIEVAQLGGLGIDDQTVGLDEIDAPSSRLSRATATSWASAGGIGASGWCWVWWVEFGVVVGSMWSRRCCCRRRMMAGFVVGAGGGWSRGWISGVRPRCIGLMMRPMGGILGDDPGPEVVELGTGVGVGGQSGG